MTTNPLLQKDLMCFVVHLHGNSAVQAEGQMTSRRHAAPALGRHVFFWDVSGCLTLDGDIITQRNLLNRTWSVH